MVTVLVEIVKGGKLVVNDDANGGEDENGVPQGGEHGEADLLLRVELGELGVALPQSQQQDVLGHLDSLLAWLFHPHIVLVSRKFIGDVLHCSNGNGYSFDVINKW